MPVFVTLSKSMLDKIHHPCSLYLSGGLTCPSAVTSQVQRTWWWRSHGRRRRIGASDPRPPLPLIPPHCISPRPPPPPAPHVIHNNPNSTITSLMSSGEEEHPGGTEEEGKRHQEVAASLSPNLFPTPWLLLVQAGTPLPEMHSSASLWVEALATRQSVKTLTDCVDEYQM